MPALVPAFKIVPYTIANILVCQIWTEANGSDLHLAVVPQCRAAQRTTYGAARKSTVQVGCHVDANPSPTRFRWQFQARVGSVRSSSGGRFV